MLVSDTSEQMPPDGVATQCDLSSHLAAGTIAGSGSIASDVIQTGGMSKVAASVHLTGGGTLQIHRYLDQAGTILQTEVAATTITGGQSGIANVGADGLPFQSIKVVVADTSGSTNTMSLPAILASSK